MVRVLDRPGVHRRAEEARETVRIALVGKYNRLADAYLSVIEALRHAGFHHGARIEVFWVDSETLDEEESARLLEEAEAALDLWRSGAQVTLVHFGPTFDKRIKPWVLPDFENRAKEGSIAVRWNSRVATIEDACRELLAY